jgi:hypothetical protein
MLRRKSKTQFENRERNMQNAIRLLNYLKRIAPQQLTINVKNVSFHEKNFFF